MFSVGGYLGRFCSTRFTTYRRGWEKAGFVYSCGQRASAHIESRLPLSFRIDDPLQSGNAIVLATLSSLSMWLTLPRAEALGPVGCDDVATEKGWIDSHGDGDGTVSTSGLGRFSVADAVSKVEDCVVNIKRKKGRVVENSKGMFANSFFRLEAGQRDLQHLCRGTTGGEFASEAISGGSGFLVDRAGQAYYILTNAHVVEDLDCLCDECQKIPPGNVYLAREKDELLVTLASGDAYSANVVATDQESDIAILRIDSNDHLPVCVLGESDSLRAGEFVVAVGSPLSVLSNSCSFGIVSNVCRDVSAAMGGDAGPTFLQVDCAVNPGSSGGPLVDLDGIVRGVLCMKIGVYDQAMTPGNGGQIPIEGISFAIPISRARKVMKELRTFGCVRQPYMGVALIAVDDSILEDMHKSSEYSYLPRWLAAPTDEGLPIARGLLVHGIEEGGPADLAKLDRGDLISHVDGVPVATVEGFVRALAFKTEEAVIVRVRRAGTGRMEELTIRPTAATSIE